MTSDDGLYLGVDVGTAPALWPVTRENPESPVPLDALSRDIAGWIWLTGWIRYLLGSLIHPGSRIHPLIRPPGQLPGRWCRSGQSGREYPPPVPGQSRIAASTARRRPWLTFSHSTTFFFPGVNRHDNS